MDSLGYENLTLLKANVLQHISRWRILSAAMGATLRHRLQQDRFKSPHQEAMLNLMVSAAHVRDRLEQAFQGHEITEPQYNVLRILRGGRPHGYARCEIARRMIARAPDLTRLVDRLEKRGLAERARSEEDRRQSVTRITRKGLELLDAMQPTMDAIQRSLTQRLSARDAKELSRICEQLYGDQTVE